MEIVNTHQAPRRGAWCFSRSLHLHVLHGDDEPPLIDLDLHRRADIEPGLLQPIALEILAINGVRLD